MMSRQQLYVLETRLKRTICQGEFADIDVDVFVNHIRGEVQCQFSQYFAASKPQTERAVVRVPATPWDAFKLHYKASRPWCWLIRRLATPRHIEHVLEVKSQLVFPDIAVPFRENARSFAVHYRAQDRNDIESWETA